MSGDCQFPEQCGFPHCFCTGMIFDFDVDKAIEDAIKPERNADGMILADPDDFDDLEPFGEDVGEEILDDDIEFLAGGDTIDELTRNFKEVMDEYGEA